jgi:hypothetical protein
MDAVARGAAGAARWAEGRGITRKVYGMTGGAGIA